MSFNLGRGCFYRCFPSRVFTLFHPCQPFRVTGKLIKKGTLFVLLPQKQIDKRKEVSFVKSIDKSVLDILKRLDIGKKGDKIKASPFGDKH